MPATARQKGLLTPAPATSRGITEGPHQWARYLAEAVRCAPSADNSQPWRLTLSRQILTLTPHAQRCSLLGTDHPAVLMSLGTAIENLFQAAAAANLDASRWKLEQTSGILHIPLSNLDRPPPGSLPQVLQRRHTNRNPCRRECLPSRLIEQIENTQEPGIRVHWIDQEERIRQLATLVRLASGLRFRDEQLHRWLAHSLRFTKSEIAQGDGLDVRTLHLPPGGGHILRLVSDWERMRRLNALGAWRLFAHIEASEFLRCGALVLIAAQDRMNPDWVAAGRIMERIWLQLNAADVAVQPYFVLPDLLHREATGRIPPPLQAEAHATATRAWEKLEDYGMPCMLLRIGRARPPRARARRLPLASILEMEEASHGD